MADEKDNNNDDGNTKDPGTTTTPTWETWIADQTDDVQGLYNSHVEGLKNTVKATREERDTMASDLRDAAAKLDKGSEAETKLTEMAGKFDAMERRAVFAEDAIRPEIGCTNPKAAYLIAQADELFDRKGNPSWDAIKKAAPELFRKPGTDTNAGSGTGGDPPETFDMNQAIRAKAGRL